MNEAASRHLLEIAQDQKMPRTFRTPPPALPGQFTHDSKGMKLYCNGEMADCQGTVISVFSLLSIIPITRQIPCKTTHF